MWILLGLIGAFLYLYVEWKRTKKIPKESKNFVIFLVLLLLGVWGFVASVAWAVISNDNVLLEESKEGWKKIKSFFGKK